MQPANLSIIQEAINLNISNLRCKMANAGIIREANNAHVSITQEATKADISQSGAQTTSAASNPGGGARCYTC